MDRKIYKKHMQRYLLNYPNLDVRAGGVFDLVLNYTAPPAHEPSSSRDVWAAIDGVRLGGSPLKSVFLTIPLIRHQIRAKSSNVLKSFCAPAHSYLEKFTLVG
jgi:hypothetical protein